MAIWRSLRRLGAKIDDDLARTRSGAPEVVAASARRWWMPLAAATVVMVVAVVSQAVFDADRSFVGPAVIVVPGAFLSGFAYNNRLRQLGRTEGGGWIFRVHTLQPDGAPDPLP